MNAFWTVLTVALIVILMFMGINRLYYNYKGKKLGGALSEPEFENGMRKAQIVDIRESDSFKTKHILGARNIPYSQFKYRSGDLRADLPVYLYGSSVNTCIRAAEKLKKNNFEEVKWLDEPFNEWSGKTKSSR